MGNKIAALVIVGLFALVGLIIVGGIAVNWITDGGLDRAWAVIATLALPAIGLGCYRLGRIEARGAMTGMQMGTQHVLSAARQAVDVRVTSATKMREALHPEPAPLLLPQPEEFAMLPRANGKTIDM